jgi:hypothetical protein
MTIWKVLFEVLMKKIKKSLLSNKKFPLETNVIKLFQSLKRERVGTFIFPDRLNDIIPLLSDKGLNKNDPNMKQTLKTIILEHFLEKCDNYEIITRLLSFS